MCQCCGKTGHDHQHPHGDQEGHVHEHGHEGGHHCQGHGQAPDAPRPLISLIQPVKPSPRAD